MENAGRAELQLGIGDLKPHSMPSQLFRGTCRYIGENIRLEHRYPKEHSDRFRCMAAALVALKLGVIVTVGPG
jgi:hypothetical protein